MEKKRSTVLTPETQWILAGILTPEAQRLLAGGEPTGTLRRQIPLSRRDSGY
jgi:hypothetical protein